MRAVYDMKIDFTSLRDLSTFPLPERKVLGNEELKEAHERMREWLKRYEQRRQKL